MLKGTLISDIEDSSEVLMLNRKTSRKPSKDIKEESEAPLNVPQKKNHDIPFKMARPLFESPGIEFEKEINDAFDSFLHLNNEKFLDHFNRLESHKNSKSNIIEKEQIIEQPVQDVQAPLHDEESENQREEFEFYKLKDDYYNKNSDLEKRRVQVEEGHDLLNNKMKDELTNLKKYNDFENGINNFKVRLGTENQYDIEVNPPNAKKEERNKRRENHRRMIVLSSCHRCYGGKLNENSIISQSENVYLSYPYFSGSIQDFHIVISTKEHINSLAAVEENVYEEIRNFMKSIVSYNLTNDNATIFLECSQQAMHVTHFEIECIPIKYKFLEDARMYFHKAFMDQDDEWTTNKKLVDTVPYKGNLTKILNEKFAYVNVDFNAQGGFLHPVENNSKFNQTFLREIMCPLLKKQIHEIKYPKKLGVKELIDTVENYKKKFDYFDWTKYS
jgi:hypothetical protein